MGIWGAGLSHHCEESSTRQSMHHLFLSTPQNEDGLPRFARNDDLGNASLPEVFDAAIHIQRFLQNKKN
jgi:hypothetical protein